MSLGRLICAKKMKSESTTKMETERLWRLLLNFARNKFFSDSVDIKGRRFVDGLNSCVMKSKYKSGFPWYVRGLRS